jgi:hypothetical protein
MDLITFYTKPGCHLCEDGQWLLEVALRGRSNGVNYVDITTDPALEQRYGERIPVLSQPAVSTELEWPFTPESILAWLDGVSQGVDQA